VNQKVLLLLLQTFSLLRIVQVGEKVDLAVVQFFNADKVLLGAVKLVGLAQIDPGMQIVHAVPDLLEDLGTVVAGIV
jgi:hypothetical protein